MSEYIDPISLQSLKENDPELYKKFIELIKNSCEEFYVQGYCEGDRGDTLEENVRKNAKVMVEEYVSILERNDG